MQLGVGEIRKGGEYFRGRIHEGKVHKGADVGEIRQHTHEGST